MEPTRHVVRVIMSLRRAAHLKRYTDRAKSLLFSGIFLSRWAFKTLRGHSRFGRKGSVSFEHPAGAAYRSRLRRMVVSRVAARSVTFDDVGTSGSIGTRCGANGARSAPLLAISAAGALARSLRPCGAPSRGAARSIVQIQAAANRLTSSKVSMFGLIQRRLLRPAA
jgi:hypothetical protein